MVGISREEYERRIAEIKARQEDPRYIAWQDLMRGLSMCIEWLGGPVKKESLDRLSTYKFEDY